MHYRIVLLEEKNRKVSTYPEPEPVLEEASDEITVCVHLHPVPAREGDHDCRNSLDDRMVISGHVDAQQPVPVDHRIVLVYSIDSATIAHEVLRAGYDLVPVVQYNKQKFRSEELEIWSRLP